MCAPGPLFASLAAEALACQCRLRHVESYFSSTTSLKRHSKNKVILSPHVSEDTCRIPSWVASLLCFRHFIARVNHCDSFIYWNYSHFISGHRERNIIGCDWIITTGKLTKIQMISNVAMNDCTVTRLKISFYIWIFYYLYCNVEITLCQ